MKIKKISISAIACISIAMLSTQAFATEVINDDLNVTGNVSVGVTSDEDTYIEVGNSSDHSDYAGVVKINGWGETIVFNDTYDTDDLPYEWSIQAENWSEAAYWSIYNEYAEDNIILLNIGEDTADNAVNSLVVDTTGDIYLANGTVFIDKSSSRMGIGTTLPAENLHIVEDDNTINAGHAGIRLEGKTDSVVWTLNSYYFDDALGGTGVTKEFAIIDNINNTTPFTIENNATTNSLYVQDGGNVGIGTGLPLAKLDVRGDVLVSLEVNNDLSLQRAFTMSANNANTAKKSDVGFSMINKREDFEWQLRTFETDHSLSINKAATGVKEMALTGSDHPDGIQILMGDGGKYSNGQWMVASSRAYKENIKEMDADTALEAFHQLKPVSFNYKTNKDEPVVGFIAEDVPDIVTSKEKDSLSAMEIVALLTKVVQVQEKASNQKDIQVKTLEKRVAKMELLLTNLALTTGNNKNERLSLQKK